ncbi:helix-turn-helix domain-containing protein (plasmid) [Aneurinibacillus sp. Ricciae_BoGa-3]|uniref:helix-turn-helix domain-containing protein n=1 Tax=Aneurinibacillus sp. Ricciae_BoGa-3 TaxID=3022697 RepID=UPI0023423151|nr:LexA family transcriptional regulator [Aneurinibacillus sp. Ricciae_BoGa-3]WCK57367.1 helix-turn-helix domain-containing protein [Aneurinibacillus sp. Ricciae_BoGa-3]
MLGNRLKEVRTRKNLSQEKIAEILICSTEMYVKLELSQEQLDLNTLIKLADFYDVSIDYLLERTDESSSENSIEKFVTLLPIVEEIYRTEEDEITRITGHESGLITQDDTHQFWFKVSDNKMASDGIIEDDLVLIETTKHVKNGELSLVAIGNENAMLFRVYYHHENIVLATSNSTRLITSDNKKSFHVIGKAKQIKRALNQ